MNNAHHDSKMSGVLSRHELTYLMDNIWDIRPSDTKIGKIANQMSIQSKLTKRFAIMEWGEH